MALLVISAAFSVGSACSGSGQGRSHPASSGASTGGEPAVGGSGGEPAMGGGGASSGGEPAIGGTGGEPTVGGSSGNAGWSSSGGEPAIGGSGGEPAVGGSGGEPAMGGGGASSGGEPAIGGTGGEPTVGGSGGEPAIGGSSGAQQQGPGSYEIAPDALVGCRAPDEPGCVLCCTGTTDDGRCSYLEGDEDWSQYDVDPWYNASGVMDGPCPDDCPACAQCSERTEQALREFESRPECDCPTLEIGIDPCFAPDSCECYCVRLQSAMQACPPAE
jgi:hypothetical protein